MIRRILMGIVMLMVFQSSLHASSAAPTKEEITKLYVASFKRAPEAGGLQYWIDSGLTLKEIAGYFFDSDEMLEEYPPDSTTEDFVEAVYLNLFNRADDPEGVAYWANEIDLGHITRAELILFAIDTDSDSDAAILANKTTVGLAFYNAGLTDKKNTIMLGVTDEWSTVTVALEKYGISAILLETLLAGKTLYTTIYDQMGTLESWTFNADITSVTWRGLVGDSDSSTVTMTLDGMTMTLIDDGETNAIVVTEILEDYMLISIDGGVEQRLYYDEAKARAYYLGGGLNSLAEVKKNIVGRWDKGCRNEGDGSEADIHIYNADGTGSSIGAMYHNPGCHPGDEQDSWDNTFTYVIGEATTGANGEDTVELDMVFSEDGKAFDYYSMLHFTAVNQYIIGDDGSNDNPNTPETRDNVFKSKDLFTKAIAITEAMLSGKTFYGRESDSNGEGYSVMTFTATEGTRHEIWYNEDGSVRGEDTFTFAIALVEGKIDVIGFDLRFILINESSDTWEVIKEKLDDDNGIETWYLSRPADFPESL